MSLISRASKGATLLVALVASTSAYAETDPKGIWLDHDGRGAVEIKDCEKGPGLCGFVVNVKEAKYADRCGLQILGNVTSGGGGWIYSPARGKRYTVSLKRLSDSKLRVVGNASSSFFSKTFTWKLAPADLQLCGKYALAKRDAQDAKDDAQAGTANRDSLRDDESSSERSATVSGDKDVKSARSNGNDKLDESETASKPQTGDERLPEYGALPEKQEGGDKYAESEHVEEAPVESEVSEVIGELIGKANEMAGKLKRKCRFRIPYVDKVIMIPCGD
jgi:uncharacterized protein (DUF2147 family)